jgi:hypothetical protein
MLKNKEMLRKIWVNFKRIPLMPFTKKKAKVIYQNMMLVGEILVKNESEVVELHRKNVDEL